MRIVIYRFTQKFEKKKNWTITCWMTCTKIYSVPSYVKVLLNVKFYEIMCISFCTGLATKFVWQVQIGRGSSSTLNGSFLAQSHPGSIIFWFFFCFLILLVSNDFCFCLRSCDQKFSAFDHFPCILECCFSFSFLSSFFYKLWILSHGCKKYFYPFSISRGQLQHNTKNYGGKEWK